MKIANHFKGIKLAVKTFAVVLLFIANTHLVQAQRDEGVPIEDVVYLKDGSVYKGIIVDEDGSFIYMDVLEGNRIDIAKWRIRKKLSNDNYLFHSGGKFHYTKGFFGGFSIGFSVAEENVSEHVSLLLGYRLNKRFSVAVGLGNELSTSNLSGFDVETSFSSYYLYGRYYPTDFKRRPFVYARAGYGSGPDEESESGRHGGGVQAQAGVGIHFASRRRSRFILSLGYHVQNTSGQQFFLDTFGNEVLVNYDDIWVNNFVLKFGIEFK